MPKLINLKGQILYVKNGHTDVLVLSIELLRFLQGTKLGINPKSFKSIGQF